MSVDEQRLKRAEDAVRHAHRGLGAGYDELARIAIEAYEAPEPPPYPTDAMVDAYETEAGLSHTDSAYLRKCRRRGIAAAIAADSTRQAIIDAAVALRDAYRAPPICADCFDAVCDAVNEAGL